MRKYLILSLAVSTNVTCGVRAIFYFSTDKWRIYIIYWILFTISKIIRHDILLTFNKSLHTRKKILNFYETFRTKYISKKRNIFLTETFQTIFQV